MEFDHAGIATDDLGELADCYETLFETPIVHEETFGELRVAFLELENGYFELLEPLPDADGPIASYLDSQGAGIHHLALRTEIEPALDRAREHDIRLIDDEPREGAWGHDVAFLHPDSTGGILIELVEH